MAEPDPEGNGNGPGEDEESMIICQFDSPGSTQFNYQRPNVDPWQLLAFAVSMKAIAEAEISMWAAQTIAGYGKRKIARL